jgi:hypothetical protein
MTTIIVNNGAMLINARALLVEEGYFCCQIRPHNAPIPTQPRSDQTAQEGRKEKKRKEKREREREE